MPNNGAQFLGRIFTPVSIQNGGTGCEGCPSAFDALAPTTKKGDLIYFDGTNNVRLPAGTPGQVLTMNASGNAPEWV